MIADHCVLLILLYKGIIRCVCVCVCVLCGVCVCVVCVCVCVCVVCVCCGCVCVCVCVCVWCVCVCVCVCVCCVWCVCVLCCVCVCVVCVCVCVCVVCVCVCVCGFMWFMRTQICLITWVLWQRYYNLKCFMRDTALCPRNSKGLKKHTKWLFFWNLKMHHSLLCGLSLGVG